VTDDSRTGLVGNGTPPASETRRAVERPPALDLGLLALAICAVSTSGPLIAAAAAPALAIAFWRNAMATGLLVPIAWVRCRAELRGLSSREWWLAVLAGAFLAAHFGTWVPSLRYTSVASATALVATQPIWSAFIARGLGHEVPRRAWVGIGVAVAGAIALTGADFSVSTRALGGDALALAGAALAAAYVAVGGEVRRSVSTTAYTTVCYGTAAVLLLVVCLVARVHLVGYSGRTWLQLVALTLGPQLLGHSVINRVLRTTPATVVSLAILFEVPGAALVAALALNQHPPAAVLPGLALLLVGLAIVVSGRQVGAPPPMPVE
jgi:drug/metabolite transporter (DMT)-like permease